MYVDIAARADGGGAAKGALEIFLGLGFGAIELENFPEAVVAVP